MFDCGTVRAEWVKMGCDEFLSEVTVQFDGIGVVMFDGSFGQAGITEFMSTLFRFFQF